ncbi:MAG: PAS domain S-box protein [Candidatus Accumulibacter phosphatis]|jgi:PAS domain S-box-containing protein
MTNDLHSLQQHPLHDENTVLGLLEAIPDGVMVLDVSGIVLYANRGAHHMFGGRELVGRDLGLPITLDGRHAEIEYIDRAGCIGRAELRASRFDWLGQPATAVSLRDTTVRYALQEQLALADQVFESAQEGIIVTAPDGVIVRVNRAFAAITGYSAEEARGMTPRLLSSGEHGRAFFERMWTSVFEEGCWQGEVTNRRKDGSLYPQSLSITRIHDADGVLTHLVGVFSDLTQDKIVQSKLAEAHSQLSQSEKMAAIGQLEKMAAIGQLAAGVVNEVNNPVGFALSNLGVLGEYADHLLRLVDAYEQDRSHSSECAARVAQIKEEIAYTELRVDLKRLVDQSREGLDRVRRIVLDLKDFSRPGEPNWQWSDLHQGLDSTLNIVWNEIKHKAKVEKRYGELPLVNCAPSQINQVFMNLLVNAAQAIEEYGRITIRTGRDAESVWVEISDNGKGIAPQNLARVFEPFFTTKPLGQGTGLGLSLSHSIVQRHRGRIEVRAQDGEGCCFRVTLPIAYTVGDNAIDGV